MNFEIGYFDDASEYFQGALSFVKSIQARSCTSHGISDILGDIQHVNAYITTVNTMFPMKRHPFGSVMPFIRDRLKDLGIITTKKWCEFLREFSKKVNVFEKDISAKYCEDFPARMELGYRMDEDLLENVDLAHRSITAMHVDVIPTRSFFQHIERLSSLGLSLMSENLQGDILSVEKTSIIAIADSIMANLIIQGSTLSFVPKTIYSSTGLDLMNQIRSNNCLDLTGGECQLRVMPDATLTIDYPLEVFVELLESLARDYANKEKISEKEFFQQMVRVIDACGVEDSATIAAELRIAYLCSLSQESKVRLMDLTKSYLSRTFKLSGRIDEAQARAAVFNKDALIGEQPGKGHHLSLMRLVQMLKSEEFLDEAIERISITIYSCDYHHP